MRKTSPSKTPGLEFAIDDASGKERIFDTFPEAAAFAIAMAASHGEPVNIDVLCWTAAAADAFGCREEYDADPDASVTQRITIKADVIGHVA